MTPPIRMVSEEEFDLLFYKLKDLILEQSEGEWDDATIVRDAHHFANHLRPLLTAAPVREEGGVVETALKIATDLHHAYEQLIYGLPKYLEAENLTDEENMIREAWITLDVTAHRIAALATREEAPERRECDDCGFKGTSDDASKEQDYCTACGGNSPAGGPDECAHCGAKNHMVMACPKCGGRFSLDEDDREEAPARNPLRA